MIRIVPHHSAHPKRRASILQQSHRYNGGRDDSDTGASMIQICYVSQATEPMTPEGLLALLIQCRRNNSARHVTGMLLYGNGTFLQVLEGEDHVVSDLVDLISQDPRHASVKLLSRRAVEARQYAEWSMGFDRVTDESLQHVEGLNEFGSQDFNFQTLATSDSAVQKLMEHYRVTHWDPLVREIDAKDKVILHLRQALVQSRGRAEVAGLVLESVIAAARGDGLNDEHLRLCESALSMLSPKS
jgi:hypothetical protein